MPELAELRLSSDYVNEHTEGKRFISTWNNPKHKSVEVPLSDFSIRTQSRGKEFKMNIIKNDVIVNSLVFGFGMTGGFEFTKKGEEPKYTHLKLFTDDEFVLCFTDKRKFGGWRFGDWSSNRSPDPTIENDLFVKHIKDNLSKSAFNKPIYELLMDQSYCNGIGNYLRAEILGRIDSNPFVSAREYIQKNPEVLELCRTIPLNSYIYKKEKGLNYNGVEPYLKYYKKDTSLSFEDRNKRVFWYDAKWGKENG